ncbi:hypothetical protein PFISCL1PPCAC_5694 [Pristionchus fissidentatus]|uniref:Uncharacterized protein n=1 Tax=Pristionchus fissidentatus TaxID=1538716 RepID=A0AAV5V801_9BILA|nr:hypothetical protein PFISCL1PPCAC_5694 [Pristionchus fissidentatus]
MEPNVSVLKELREDVPLSPAKPVYQVRRAPRLRSPGVEIHVTKPKPVKEKPDWSILEPSMPVLEKEWIAPSPTKKRDDNLVWKWIRQAPGQHPIGRWMEPDEEINPMLIDYNEEEATYDPAADHWAERARTRRRMAAEERKRIRLLMSAPLILNDSLNEEMLDQPGPSNVYEDESNSPVDPSVEEELEVDVVAGGTDPLPLSHIPPRRVFLPQEGQWVALYEEAPPPPPSEVFDEKHPDYDPIAVAAVNRARVVANRMNRMERAKEEEARKQQLRAEREEKLKKEAEEMNGEKKRKEPADDAIQSKRMRRASYVRRLRAEKRMEMGEEEWMKHLERERIKRRERETAKCSDPAYVEKKRLRATLKTREIRANRAICGQRREMYYEQRGEEVYEDGVYQMEETQVDQTDEGDASKTEDDEMIEVEKW